MWKFLSLLVSFSFYTTKGKAQGALTDNKRYIAEINKPNIVSPTLAALGNYGDIPVGHYTGIPQISIPLYTLEGKGIQVPIGLSYHAGGLKVEQVASWVGLGWSLQAGGVINRKVNGLPDEGTSNGVGFVRNTDKISTFFHQWVNNPYNAAPHNFKGLLRQIRLGYLDAEPDLFSFTTPTASGKFLFNQDLQQFIPYPFTPTKIKAGIYLNTWSITDDQGNSYEFSSKEQSVSLSLCNTIPKWQDEITSGWYLTKITNTNRTDSIVFTYEPVAYTYKNLSSSTKYLRPSNLPSKLTDQECFSEVSISGAIRLASVQGSGGRVEFIKSATQREDISGDYSLEEIVVKNNSQQIIKRYKFNYSYYVSDIQVAEYKRLKLLSVDEVNPINPAAYKRHAFDYNTIPLPGRLSYAQDHWGYYNGASNTMLVPNQAVLLDVKKYIPIYSTQQEQILERLNLRIGTADRSVNTNYTQAGILNKITYPTGGSTEFVFENNTARLDKPPYELVQPSAYSYNHSVLIAPFLNSGQEFENEYVDSIVINEIPHGGNDYSNGAKVNIFVSHSCGTEANSDCPSFLIEGPVTFLVTNNMNNRFLPNGKYYLRASRLHTIQADERGTKSFSFGLSYLKHDSLMLQGLMRSFPLGGLRVKEIITKEQNKIASRKIFQYSSRDDTGAVVSTGMMQSRPLYVTPEYIMDDVSMTSYLTYLDDSLNIGDLIAREAFLQSGPSDPLGLKLTIKATMYPGAFNDLHFKVSSNSSRALSDENNYAVGYSKVKEIQVGENSRLVKEYSFSNFDQYQPIFSNTFPNSFSYDEYWKRGNNLATQVYKNDTLLQQENRKGYEFPLHRIREDSVALNPIFGMSIARNMWHSTSNISFDSELVPFSEFYFHLTQQAQVKADTTVYYSTPVDSLQTIVRYAYGKNGKLVQTLSINSQQDVTEELLEYPADYLGTIASSPLRDTLINRNMMAALLRKELKVNGQPIHETLYDYGLHNNKLLLDSVRQRFKSASLAKEVSYPLYDEQGNVLMVTTKDGIKTTYLWGYKGQYPVAKVIGVDHATAVHHINPAILDNPADDTQLRTELHKLRQNLPNAMITTYTYKPSVGISSETDANNRTAYYEYDGFNRLSLIRNEQGNILKKYCYNYQGQVEECGIYVYSSTKSATYTKQCTEGGVGTSHTYTVTKTSILSQVDADNKALADVAATGQAYANQTGNCTWSSEVQSGSFTKQCTEGGIGSQHVYTVNAGVYTSAISKADANQKALNDVAANGQAYTNNVGVCTWTNAAQSGTYTKQCTDGGTGSSVTYTVGAGTYSSTISKADANQKAINAISQNGQTYANQNGTCTWVNNAKSGAFTKQCVDGGTGSNHTYTVNAGAFNSTISKADANQKAQNAVNQNGQAYANAVGMCTWSSDIRTGTFTKQCADGGTGTQHTYTVAAGAYTSTLSKADANQKAQNEVDNNGQAYTNNIGSCTWYNDNKSGSYYKQGCPSGHSYAYYVTVPANSYSSTISKADANQKAVQYAQSQANQYGTCIPACNASTCTGNENKCINGSCETGVRVYTASVYNENTGLYDCTYHYEWSDGSWSQDYTMSSFLNCLGGGQF